MTYKDVLDDLFDIISRHKMIQTVGYGPLSDIKVPKDGAETNYPYAFIRPTNYTIGKNQMTYRFDLIMMEMCNDTDEEIIKAQSDCHQYLKDILAELYYNMEKYDFNLNNSITVFQEKYDDVVSGATLQLELVVRDQLNDCIAPFESKPEDLLELHIVKTSAQNFDPDSENSPIKFQDIIVDVQDAWRPVSEGGNFWNPKISGTYRAILTGSFTLTEEPLPTAPNLVNTANGGTSVEPDNTNWPTNATVGQTYSFFAEYENIEAVANKYMAWNFPDEPPLEGRLTIPAGAVLKIYRVE